MLEEQKGRGVQEELKGRAAVMEGTVGLEAAHGRDDRTWANKKESDQKTLKQKKAQRLVTEPVLLTRVGILTCTSFM